MLSTLSNMEMEIDSFINHIDIFWDEYELREVKKYILVRKRYSVPMNVRDGMVVYNGLDTMCSDTNIKNGDLYYYRLFICFSDDEHSNDVISDSKCVIKAIGFTNDIDYGIEIYNTFPEQVKYDDVKQKPSLPLKRLMQTIGFSFNRIETYTDTMLQQMDIDKCDEIYLPYMAKWVGLDYNEHLGADMNRLIIKTWNEIRPYMNTSNGIRYLLQRMFRAECNIKMENDVVIDIKFVGDNNIWLLRYVTYIKTLIQKFCNYSINYDFAIHIIDTVEKYTIGWDNYYLDILHELFNETLESELQIDTFDVIMENSKEQYDSSLITSNLSDKLKHLLYDDYMVFPEDYLLEQIRYITSEQISGYTENMLDCISENVVEIRNRPYCIGGFTNNMNNLVCKNFYTCGNAIDYDILIDKFLTLYDEVNTLNAVDSISECSLRELTYECITDYSYSVFTEIRESFIDLYILSNIKDIYIDKFKTFYLEQLNKQFIDNYLYNSIKETSSENFVGIMSEDIYDNISELNTEVYQKIPTDVICERTITFESFDIFSVSETEENKFKTFYLEQLNKQYEDTYDITEDGVTYNYERWGFTNDTSGLICGTFYTCDNII